jgi:hypothetical protein
VTEENVYTNNGPDSNIFGLEPNYGCCTANMHQGWPKLATHLWMASRRGVTAFAYAPSRLMAEIDGVPVIVELATDYPFRSSLALTVSVDGACRFPLSLRIPSWVSGPSVAVEGIPIAVNGGLRAGTFLTLEREWFGDTTLEVRFPMSPRAERRFNDSVSISRGPLVYALQVEEEWRHLRGEEPHADWEVHPRTKWNYAVALDAEHPERSVRFGEREGGHQPFSVLGSPVSAVVEGRQVPEWRLDRGAAAPPPESPVRSSQPAETLTLLPYGCARLRVTEMPVLSDEE